MQTSPTSLPVEEKQANQSPDVGVTESDSEGWSVRSGVQCLLRPFSNLTVKKKVFILLLLQSLLVVVAFSVLISWAFDRGFAQYTNAFDQQRAREFARSLEVEYASTGSWQALIDNPQRWAELAMISSGHQVTDLTEVQAMFSQFKPDEFPESLTAPLPLRFVLFDAQGKLLFGKPTKGRPAYEWKIEHAGATVGVLNLPVKQATTYDQQFQQRFVTALGVIVAGSVLLAMVPAFFIARVVTRPVRDIGQAARILAAGRTPEPLSVTSNDELGTLARDFNDLSIALARNQNLQRQWLAEIAHELRTPVAILMAEAEALQDGVRIPTTEAFQSLHDELSRLSRLIDDLHQLSSFDGGIATLQRVEVNFVDLLKSCVAASQTRFNQRHISIHAQLPEQGTLRMIGDPDRLTQVFMNLLENSLRYTDEGGTVQIIAQHDGGDIKISFEDSSPGVAEHEIPLLFKRMYRGEASRSRAGGGAGLGLAIVQSIINAHRGTVTVARSALGGLRFDIQFGKQDRS